MRRHDKEIKEYEKMQKILRETSFVTLAMCMNNIPYLVSLNHSYDEINNCLYFHCADEGKKLDFLHSNPNVWGQALIDYGYHEGQCSHLYISVMFKGVVEFIERLEEKREILKHMIIHQEKNSESMMNRLVGIENNESLNRTIVAKIKIKELTGKKSTEIDF